MMLRLWAGRGGGTRQCIEVVETRMMTKNTHAAPALAGARDILSYVGTAHRGGLYPRISFVEGC